MFYQIELFERGYIAAFGQFFERGYYLCLDELTLPIGPFFEKRDAAQVVPVDRWVGSEGECLSCVG